MKHRKTSERSTKVPPRAPRSEVAGAFAGSNRSSHASWSVFSCWSFASYWEPTAHPLLHRGLKDHIAYFAPVSLQRPSYGAYHVVLSPSPRGKRQLFRPRVSVCPAPSQYL